MYGKALASSIPDGAHELSGTDDTPRANRPVHSHDQHGHYTHELSENATETVSRVLIRSVPLAYGALLGSLSDNLFIGLAIAFAVSLALDLSMGRDSLARNLFSRRQEHNA